MFIFCDRSDESGDLELSGSSAAGLANYDDENTTDDKIDQPLSMETIKVEISTPADFKDVYYEIATIKSPYTFQVIVSRFTLTERAVQVCLYLD